MSQSYFSRIYLDLPSLSHKHTFLQLISMLFIIPNVSNILFEVHPPTLTVCHVGATLDAEYNYIDFEKAFCNYAPNKIYRFVELLDRVEKLTPADIDAMFVFPNIDEPTKTYIIKALLNYLNNVVLFNVIAHRYPLRINSEINQNILNRVHEIERCLNETFTLNLDSLTESRCSKYIDTHLMMCLQQIDSMDYDALYCYFYNLQI